jgi:murein DD-endopeptidase MepM/ murein hydrolase activator NlpD
MSAHAARRAILALCCAALSASAACKAPPAQTPAPTVTPPAPAPTFTAVGGIRYRGKLTQGGWLQGTAPAGTRSVTLGGEPLALADDGAFFAAFDRDAPATLSLATTDSSGLQLAVPLPIAPRAWKIEHIGVAKRPGGLAEPAFRARRAGELARIRAARKLTTDAEGWRQAMIWPASGRISGRFGAQRIYRGEPGAYHSGTDIAAPAGAPITAPAGGVVVLAATDAFTLEGHLLIIDHGMGLSSAFLHCADLAVREGDVVRQGDLLGHVGMTGRATGPHLHWALTWRGRRLDPQLFAPFRG